MIEILNEGKASYGVYGGDAYETYKKVTKGINPITPNKLYVNDEFGKVFYINNSGYLHIYDLDGGWLVDLMLTKDNKLKETSHSLFNKSAKEKFKKDLQDAEHI